jgi:N-ethylmaleimide reductase
MTRLLTIQPGDIPSPMMVDFYGQRAPEGGHVFMQLIHGGRQSHIEMIGGVAPVAPSVVPFDGVALTKDGFVPVSPHPALTLEEIPYVVDEFRVARQRSDPRRGSSSKQKKR